MSHNLEADELRVRDGLRRLIDGQGAETPPPPPSPPPDDHQPAGRPRDWLDDILDSNTAPPSPPPPAAPKNPAAPPPGKDGKARPKRTGPAQPKARSKAKPGTKRRDPAAPHSPLDGRPENPRQSLADAWDRVPHRLKWLGYHATGAYLGWSVGLIGYATHVTAWIADTGLVGVQAVFWYTVAALAFLLHHRTRAWWRPVAWLAAIPASSTVVGVLLYGTPHP